MANVEPELIEATKTKLAAEAEAALQHASEHAAIARQVTANAEIAELELATAKHMQAMYRAGDWENHVYNFLSPVNEKSVSNCISLLTVWHRLDRSCEITIVFFSPGGDVFQGMALWDFLSSLKAKGHKIITVARGMAASMAGILLQAGDHRQMGRESYLLIHEGSVVIGGSMGEVEDQMGLTEKMGNRILDIYAEKSTLTRTQIARRWKRKNWWLDSAEALELGFCDEVV